MNPLPFCENHSNAIDRYFLIKQVRASTLFYRHLSSNGQWRASLPKGEEAYAVAAGTGWAAVATSNNFLRIFSNTGLQDGVVWLDGSVVSMAGHKDRLFVVYHGVRSVCVECVRVWSS